MYVYDVVAYWKFCLSKLLISSFHKIFATLQKRQQFRT